MKNKQPIHKIFLSVLAAFCGIQSSQKAKADFQESSPWVYIIVGIVFLICLVFGLVVIVSKVAGG